MGKNNRAVSTNFGSLIKLARQKKDYSLKDIEEKTGISASYINRLEHSERRGPSYPIIELLADALDLDITELLDVTSNKGINEAMDITELLLSNDFTISNNIVEKKAKEALISILDEIASVTWNEKTKLQDSFQILELVEELKKELAG